MLAYRLTQRSRVFAPVIIFAAGYQIRYLLLVILKLTEQITLTVIAHGLFGQTKRGNLKVTEPGHDSTPGNITLVIH